MTDIDIDAIRNDLDEVRANVAHAEAQHNPHALTALAVGDALLAKVDELTAELAEARAEGRRQAAADAERMPITLGDVGWQHLEAKAVEADYPAGLVRRRRTRDDFTTCTIEAAYQYGYRQAAKVARGEVAPR